MSKPTGKTYEIRTVKDFLTVPQERWDVCLGEFSIWLGIVGFGRVLEEHGLAVPLPQNETFVWHDDGDGSVNVHVQDESGAECLTVKTTLETKGR